MDASGGLLHWHIDAVATMDLVHRFAGVTETWFKSVTVFIAALWLVYRVYLVTIKPVDELVALLGLEVPAQPDVSLAGVKADGVMLHWKPPDWQSLVTKHHVHINGVNVGEVTHRETAVTVYNLKPDHSYTARVVALNSHFQTASEALRFTTLPASSDEFYSEQRDDETTLVDGEEEDATPTLRPSKALFDASSLHLPAAQPMTREHSNSLSQKRAPQARRVSTFVAMNDAGAAHAQEASDSEEAVKDLTSRLEHLRRENDEAERLEKDELDEFESARNALVEERDRYKQQLKEKDDTSRELKKEVTRLERANTSVQGSKNTAERKLQSKHNERRKVKDDIARWESEMEEMKAAVEKLLEQRSTLEKETETRLDAFRDQLAREQDANKSLEEDIREKAMQIKSLEQEKRKMSDGEVETAMQTEDALDEEARQFEDKLRSLQGRYTMAWSTMNQAEAVYSQCQQHLDRLQQRRLSSPQAFASTPTMEAAPLRGASGRRRRQGSIRSDANSPPAAPFGPNGPQFSSSSISSISPTFASGLPFFNYMNGGIQFEPEVAQPAPLSQSQIDALTGGAPMSPSTAGALLPSNLLSDDVDQGAISDIESEMKKENSLPKSTANPQNHRSHTLNDENSSINQQSNRNSAILPGLGAIPGLGAVLASEPASKVPSSPVSADSRSPSVFTSPKESTTHLPHQDIFNEVDRRSLRSNTGSSRGASGTSRFFGGLSLRHRGKASTDEGLTLGSLKTAETQSLPRQDPPEQGAAASRRRGSHSGGGWMGMPSISQAFSRTSKDAEEAGQATNELSKPSRLRPFGMFGKSGDPWLASGSEDRSASPRPPSTHSADTQKALPRPATGNEIRFGWPADGNVGDRQRIGPLNGEWGVAGPLNWSRHPSRRPSVQHGPSNLGQDIVTLDFEDQPVRRSPSQAPIGTRPETSGQNSASGSNSPGHSTLPNVKPTLNPNAPSFSFFTRSKKKDDGEDTDRSARKEDKKSKDKKGKDRDKDANAQPDFDFGGPETPRGDLSKESSPPGSRRSRDTRSISTADGSFFDLSIPRDSLEQTQSRTPSDAQQGGGGGQLTPVSATARESFMQKLSRKTSATSSKLKTPFSFTTRKATSSAVAGDGAAGTPEETDEDLSRSVESVGATPPAAGAASSPLVRPSVDGGVEDADARKSKDGKATRRSWSSLKLSRRERRKEREEESVSESVDASETGEEDEGVVHEVV